MSKLTSAIAVLGVVAGLGVAALPLSSYAAETTDKVDGLKVTDYGTDASPEGNGIVEQNTAIKMKISKMLTIETGAAEVELTTSDGTNYKGDPLTVTVATNNTKGYKLTIAGSASTTVKSNLTSGTNTSDVIIPASGTVATPAPLALNGGASAWGYNVSGDHKAAGFTDNTKYAGVTDDGATIASSAAPTTNDGVATTVTFGAVVKDGQPAGEYTGQVTFTASDITDTNPLD